MSIDTRIRYDLERMSDADLRALAERAEHFAWSSILALCVTESELRAYGWRSILAPPDPDAGDRAARQVAA